VPRVLVLLAKNLLKEKGCQRSGKEKGWARSWERAFPVSQGIPSSAIRLLKREETPKRRGALGKGRAGKRGVGPARVIEEGPGAKDPNKKQFLLGDEAREGTGREA